MRGGGKPPSPRSCSVHVCMFRVVFRGNILEKCSFWQRQRYTHLHGRLQWNHGTGKVCTAKQSWLVYLRASSTAHGQQTTSLLPRVDQRVQIVSFKKQHHCFSFRLFSGFVHTVTLPQQQRHPEGSSVAALLREHHRT